MELGHQFLEPCLPCAEEWGSATNSLSHVNVNGRCDVTSPATREAPMLMDACLAHSDMRNGAFFSHVLAHASGRCDLTYNQRDIRAVHPL